MGTIIFYIQGKQISLPDVLYVPSLSHSLFSVQKHVQQPDNTVHFVNNLVSVTFSKVTYRAEIYDEPILRGIRHPVQLSNKDITLFPTAKPVSNNIIAPSFRKFTQFATTPSRSTYGSAGLDLYSAQDVSIPTGKRVKVHIDIALSLPKGVYGRIASRSGLSMRHNIDVVALC